MCVLNIFESFQALLIRSGSTNKQSTANQNSRDYENYVFVLTEKIYQKMISVLDSLIQIRQESYDIAFVKLLLHLLQ